VQTVAVLFARSDSVYKSLPGADVWDLERDALRWPGGSAVVAHPPCRMWGRLRPFARGDAQEKALAVHALGLVRRCGGVLEHPAHSSLWKRCNLPRPGEFADEWGGWTLAVDQFDFGHEARKPTWLYVVGVAPSDLPPIPRREGRPARCIRKPRDCIGPPTLTHDDRERTPAPFANWLLDLARLTRRAVTLLS